ncbi:uncharacterized protein [Pseudorasbora parva]|uniref:uncharacterized protein n=1 Tax=Pseudorasbora parva TaxID=51549 RepID=UPI00351E5B9E
MSLEMMSRQKQNLLWLMIVCCASGQISCSKRMVVGDSLTGACFWNSSKTDFKLSCSLACFTEIKDVECTMNVKINTSCLGHCVTDSFNITNNGGNYEVKMNKTAEDIELWFLPNEFNCEPLKNANAGEVLNKIVTCNCYTTLFCTSVCNLNGNSSSGCLIPTVPTVNPKEMCENATYDDYTCRDNVGSKYFLRSNGSGWSCVTCDKTSTFIQANKTTSIKPPEKVYNLTSNAVLKDMDGFIDPSNASVALDKLKSLMEQMKKNNTNSSAIVMGDIIGILQIQAENTETEDACYSIKQNMIYILDCQSDLNTEFDWSVTVSSEAFDQSRLGNNGTAFAGVLRFKNMGKKNETKNYTVLNNEVYGITMGANISNLTDNIEMFITQKDLVMKVLL